MELLDEYMKTKGDITKKYKDEVRSTIRAFIYFTLMRLKENFLTGTEKWGKLFMEYWDKKYENKKQTTKRKDAYHVKKFLKWVAENYGGSANIGEIQYVIQNVVTKKEQKAKNPDKKKIRTIVQNVLNAMKDKPENVKYLIADLDTGNMYVRKMNN